MPSDDAQFPPVSRRQIIRRGLGRRCPNCGSGGLFRHGLILRYRCTSCGLKLSRSEGFFLGAMVWNYGLTVFGVLPFILLSGWQGWISWSTVVVLSLISGILFPVLFYRQAWGLWLASYYFILPHELPANHHEDRPVDEDE